MPQFPAVIELSDLDGTDGFTFFCAPHDNSHCAPSTAGDVNGDGFADLIIGSAVANPNGEDSGASYVIFGHAGSFDASLSVPALNGGVGFSINGEDANDKSGFAVSSAGDVNGDGWDDFMIGAPNARDGNGFAYVVFGSGAGFQPQLELSDLDGSNGFRMKAGHRGDAAGISVDTAGDINGDGYDDFIVGAYNANPHGRTDAGTTYVVFGRAHFHDQFRLSGLDGTDGFALHGERAYDNCGRRVASAGDVNGDGFDDLLVGAPANSNPFSDYDGSAYVIFGHASGYDPALDLTDLDGSNGFKIQSTGPGDGTGFALASAGDVNGDGLADIIVGASGIDDPSPNIGNTYVIYGQEAGFGEVFKLDDIDGTNGFVIVGEHVADRSGSSVSSAGDVNGDGFDDLFVGADEARPNGFASGAAYVVFGSASGLGPELQLADLDGENGFKINGTVAQSYTSSGQISSADVNGDGLSDLILGAPNAVYNSDKTGAGYVVFGIAPEDSVHLAGTVASQNLVGSDSDDKLRGLGGDDRLFGNDGADRLRGDHGADIMRGGLGADILAGGQGADVFVLNAAAESTSVTHDTTKSADFTEDRFDLSFSVAGIDGAVTGALTRASFDGDLAAALDGSHLGEHHAVLFTADSGGLVGQVFLVIDANETAGYQAGEDYVINLANPKHLGALDTSDFI